MSSNPAQQIVPVVRALNPFTADRAVNWKAMGGFEGERAERYRKERLPELLVIKEGQRATEFNLARVCSTFFWRKVQGVDTGRLHELCIRAGLVSVALPNGQVLRPASADKQDGQDVADVDWFNLIGRTFGESVVSEMTGLILRLAQVPEDEKHPFGSSAGLDLED